MNEVAQVVCSDCGESYYAELVKRGDRWEIGARVPKPNGKAKIRRQNMLCGDCRGKGGAGDQLQRILEQQRGMMGGGDPFGLGIY